MKRFACIVIGLLIMASCTEKAVWTSEESRLILGGEGLMRVLTVDEPADSLVLRAACADLSAEALQANEYTALCRRMISTVTDPSQDGVGIAGPQVGVLRRVVAVQRFDKEGEPFEVYPNIRIVAFRGEREPGPEGCLSVPGKRGEVLRWRDIDISYTSLETLQDTIETVQGFTAVIFQHECDHLDGILYTDKLNLE
ncbi:MAG: peptide deformylase [Bacteroidales bacterium]|nr:peptide deformylase [Bacteroidales bacterium]